MSRRPDEYARELITLAVDDGAPAENLVNLCHEAWESSDFHLLFELAVLAGIGWRKLSEKEQRAVTEVWRETAIDRGLEMEHVMFEIAEEERSTDDDGDEEVDNP